MLAGIHYRLCVVYTCGISEENAHLENICVDIGDVHRSGGLCIVANFADATCVAVLSSTVDVGNTHNAPIVSISLGEGLPRKAVRSFGHFHVNSVRVGLTKR